MISIVAPVFNEAESLRQFHAEVSGVLLAMAAPYEIIYVDDGSTDGSADILMALAQQHPHTHALILRRNYGQTAAFSAGIAHARGDVIVTIDADNQNDPADIPALLAELNKGYDVVSGWRYQRQDASLSRKLPSRIANWAIGAVTGVKLHDYGCSLKAYDAPLLRQVRLYGELHRFIPALCFWHGARVTEAKVNHRPRTKGTSKYGIGRTLRVLLDLLLVKYLISYVTRPIQLFGTVGLASTVLGTLLCAYLAVDRLCFQHPLSNRPLLLLGVLFILLGVQFVALGLMCEMISRVYYESQNRLPYSIRKTYRASS
ncbi:MAG: glycosyltransferase family 2 protein [bacterium]|nr:glycosyltransferase family 2 protein [bacterium]